MVNTDDVGADEPAEEGDDLDFSSLKKKKKRVIDEQIAALDAQLEEAGVIDDKEADIDGDDPFAKGEGEEEVMATENEEEGWLKSDRDYTYEEVHSIYPYTKFPALAQGVSYSPRE